jgi:hypothetical protein
MGKLIVRNGFLILFQHAPLRAAAQDPNVIAGLA